MSAAAPLLETRDVGKVYGAGESSVAAVNGVTLGLERGEMLLIMGPSGSGKTTLLSIMGCILRPSRGEVLIEGQAVNMLREDLLPGIRKRYFGFVFQSFNLFPSLTAAENVELVLRLKQTDRSVLKSASRELLGRVGLSARAGFYPADLSGGEKQRVAFARALAGDPPIILADEPTANLDTKTGVGVLTLLRDMVEQSGKAIVIVSHDPKAEALAHRIVFLEDGRIRR